MKNENLDYNKFKIVISIDYNSDESIDTEIQFIGNV